MRALILAPLLALAACTTAQKERVTTTLATICTSAPLAQSLYNVALATHDNARVNEIFNYLQATCPAVLVIIQTVPVKEPTPPPPVVPVPGPERG